MYKIEIHFSSIQYTVYGIVYNRIEYSNRWLTPLNREDITGFRDTILSLFIKPWLWGRYQMPRWHQIILLNTTNNCSRLLIPFTGRNYQFGCHTLQVKSWEKDNVWLNFIFKVSSLNALYLVGSNLFVFSIVRYLTLMHLFDCSNVVLSYLNRWQISILFSYFKILQISISVTAAR